MTGYLIFKLDSNRLFKMNLLHQESKNVRIGERDREKENWVVAKKVNSILVCDKYLPWPCKYVGAVFN